MLTGSQETSSPILAAILSDESFRPSAPRSIEETGLNPSLVESLVCKYLGVVGSGSGREIAEHLCLPFGILEGLFQSLRSRQIMVHTGAAPLNDYYYTLTEQGRDRAGHDEACAYVGPAPVPLADYVLSVEAQIDPRRGPRRDQLEKAFADISVDADLFEDLGPAINSGAGHVPLRRARATASRRSPSGSRCASASTSGFRRPWSRTAS